MRDVIFRGKRVDNGEWVEGFFVERIDRLTLIPKCYILVQEEDTSGITGEPTGYLNTEFSWYEVIPETVRQYTGLTDKNGKMVFEGDIVKDNKLDYRLLGDNGGGNRTGISVVKFGLHEVPSDDPFCWGNAYGFYFDGETIYPTPSQYKPHDKDSQFEFEVIGKIHDNPELLKGAIRTNG